MAYAECPIPAPLRRRHTFLVICLAIAAWLTCGPLVSAEPASAFSAPLLVPSNSSSLALMGCHHLVTLQAVNEGTVIQGVQRYTLHNNHGELMNTNLMLIPSPGVPLRALAISYANTTQDLDPNSPSEAAVALEPGQTLEITVTYETSPIAGRLVQWAWNLEEFQPWGDLPPMRLVLDLAERITDEVFLVASPSSYALKGSQAVWDLAAPQAMELVLLAPATWRELANLRMTDDAQALGQLYLDIGSDAAALGLADGGMVAAGIGELLTAVERTPDDATLRTLLVELYAGRADAHPDQRLPYLLLAIEQIEAIPPSSRTAQITQRLGELSLNAALAAEEAANPSLAFKLLQQAEASLGTELVSQREEALALRLALSLAESGRLHEALEAIEGKLSPQTRDALLRYAPPFASVVTTVTVSSETRMAVQSFRLYAPTAEATCQALQEWTTKLDATGAVSAVLTFRGETALLLVEMPWSLPEGPRARFKELLENLDQQNLLNAVVRSPWITASDAYTREQTFWRTAIRYQEQVDLRDIGTLWAGGDSLVQWQAVEIEAAFAPGNEPSYEQRLAYRALAEQRDIWRDMPHSSYWIYQIVRDGEGTLEPIGRIAFGEDGQVIATLVHYNYGRLAIVALVGIILMIALLSWAGGNVYPTNKRRLP